MKLPRSLMLLASSNQGKVREIKALLEGLSVQICCLTDFPAVPTPLESATDCFGNAQIKADYYAHIFQMDTLADDTSLACATLNGWPGVHAARVADTDAERRSTLISRLRAGLNQSSCVGQTSWPATFTSVICFKDYQKQKCYFFSGCLSGYIRTEESGHQGFGYDPIFYLPDGRSLAELSLAEKNTISHRSLALQSFKKWFHYTKED